MAKKKRGPGRPPGSKNKPKVIAKKAAAPKRAVKKPVKAVAKKKVVAPRRPAPRAANNYYRPEPLADLPTLSAVDMARIEREMFSVDSPSDLPDFRDMSFPDGSEVNDTRSAQESALVREAQNRARYELLVNRLKQLEQVVIELASMVKNSQSSIVGGFGTPRGF